jgi:serine phosphatase RsbU (regulator of sigma subunit)/ligand-binding sensor protein
MFRADGSAFTDLLTVSPYCRTIASDSAGQSLCVQSRRDLAMEAMQTGQTQEALCHAGVRMVAVPLMLVGEAVAASVVSLHPAPDNRDSVFVTARHLDMEPGALLDAAGKMPPLSPSRVKAAVRLLEDLHRLYALQLAAVLEAHQVKRQVSESGQRIKALYNTTRAISSTLSLDQTGRILVEQMAITAGLDRCLLALRDPLRNRLKPASAFGLNAAENQRFLASEFFDLGIRPEWWDRLEQGRVVLLPLDWVRQTPAHSIFHAPEDRRTMLVPVVSGGTLWAVAYMDGARDADALTQQETDLVLAIAGQAGIAIANISQYQQEQRVARTLQESLLSPMPSVAGDYSIENLYVPALAEAQVGGDFFDLVRLDDRYFAFFLGDVSGKGIEAAVHTGMMKYMARGLVVDDPSPATLVTRLNRAVMAQNVLDSSFITFFYALVDDREHCFQYVNAGHEPPLLYHAHHDESQTLAPNGPAIGLLEVFDYPQEERRMSEGDSLLVYTDGAVEARNKSGEFYGLEGLKKSFELASRQRGHDIVPGLHDELLRFTGGGLQDDLALLVIRR